MKAYLRIILRQTLMEFRKRYLGTFLGGVWALISPLITTALIYFVFTFGLKTGVTGNVSFINWLVPGMLVWFFMSEAITQGCTAITENSHLVTKLVFPVQLLPPTKVLASIPAHLFLMLCLLLVFLGQGTGTWKTWWQLAYYFGCAVVFCVALTYVTAACMVFVRDTGHVVGIFVQVFFWATPIFWDPAMLAGSRLRLILLAPFSYVVQGYRDSLFHGVYFWNKPLETVVFWLTTILVAGVGWMLFKRTRPHFADVL